MRKGNKSEVFTRFFLSYIVILIIPFLVFSGWVLYIMEGMRETSVRESQYVLNSLRDSVDAQMELIYSDILTLNYNMTINDLLRSPKQQKDIGKLLASRNEIKHLQNDEEVIYVYLPDEDVFLSSKGVYSKLEQMYGKVFAYGDMEYEDFHEKILNGGAQKVFLPETTVLANSKEHSAILYLERIPFGVQTGKGAQVLIFIDTTWIEKEIENYVKEAGRWFGIYTKEKKLIYSTENCPENMSEFLENYNIEETPKRNGSKINDCIYTSVQSNFNGWMFVSGISQRDLYKSVTGIQIVLLLLFLVYTLVGCGAAYFIAQQNLKPLRKLLALRSGEDEIAEGKVNEYQLLESYFQDIISQNQELAESNSGYLEKMQEIWMQNLICGRYNTQEEIDELGLTEISGFERFQVMVIDVAHTSLVTEEESIDKFNARRYQVKMLMKALNMEQMVVAEINMYQLGILFYSMIRRKCLMPR